MDSGGIIPDIIDKSPEGIAHVTYEDDIKVNLGNEVAEGQVIAEYIGSGPPDGTGLHRYVFLVFQQSEKIVTNKFIPKTSREGRLSIKTRDYISKYNLGNPIAGNFYQAQYDDYVPILKAQLN
ncbi:hypothetical protein DOY81_003269 [Sarcophaga bullata]|nr:hypothetical protein DOY81_003269 [Sarcophaga bullata]